VPTEWQEVAGWDEMTKQPGTISAEQCVREALAAYDRGARSVVPGALFRWAMRATALAPKPLQLRITERMYRPE
jgi:short-subunit dehydrogenase